MNRPDRCAYPITCQMVVQTQDAMCIGNLYVPEAHENDFNTHRLCFFNSSPKDEEWSFHIQINKTDAWNLRRILDAVFFKKGTGE